MIPTVSDSRGGRPLLAVGSLFFLLGYNGANWLARMPAIRQGLKLDDRGLGLLLLMSGIGAVLSFRAAGFWSRRLPSQTLATVSAAAIGLLLCLPAATGSPYVAGATLVVSGYASGLLDIAMNANAVALERHLGRPILAALHGYCSLGGAAGAASGVLAAALGVSPLWHLLTVGLLAAGVALLAGQHLLVVPATGSRDHAPVRLQGPLIVLGAVAFCSSVGEGGIAQWIAVFFRDELSTSDAVAGVGFLAFSAAMTSGRLFGDRVTGAWPPEQLLTRCGVLAAASLGIGLAIDTPPLVIVCLIGVGLGLSLVIPAVFRSATAQKDVPAASALSAVATLSYGGFLFGPPSVGFLSHRVGLRWALSLIVALCLLLALLGRRVKMARRGS